MTNDSEIVVQEKISGPISDWLSNNGFENIPLKEDHLGIEVIKISPNNLLSIVEALKNDGFNYLQCQGGYDEGPGLNIVCFYNLIEMNEFKEDIYENLNPMNVVKSRNSLGGTGFDQVKLELNNWKKKLFT